MKVISWVFILLTGITFLNFAAGERAVVILFGGGIPVEILDRKPTFFMDICEEVYFTLREDLAAKGMELIDPMVVRKVALSHDYDLEQTPFSDEDAWTICEALGDKEITKMYVGEVKVATEEIRGFLPFGEKRTVVVKITNFKLYDVKNRVLEKVFDDIEGRGPDLDSAFDIFMSELDPAIKRVTGFSTEVLDVRRDSGEAIIGLGARDGVVAGECFKVYKVGEPIKGPGGVVIGTYRRPVGVVRAKNVQRRFTICDIIIGRNSIKAGDEAVKIPKGEIVGTIVGKYGGRLAISLGREYGVRKGFVFGVYKVRHSVKKGGLEIEFPEKVGEIRIVDVKNKYSFAEPVISSDNIGSISEIVDIDIGDFIKEVGVGPLFSFTLFLNLGAVGVGSDLSVGATPSFIIGVDAYVRSSFIPIVKSVGVDVIPSSSSGKMGAQVEVCFPSPIFGNTSISVVGRVSDVSNIISSDRGLGIGLRVESPDASGNLRLVGGSRFDMAFAKNGSKAKTGLEGFLRLGVRMLSFEF